MKNTIIPSWVIYGILFIAAFLFVFLFSCTTSPLYEHHPFWFHGDSGIFQEMGVCLAQGGTPYLDLFDHKGPVLWFIEALGILLSPKWGIMALQTLSLFCTILIWYKTICLIIEKSIPAVLLSILGLLFLLAFYQRGNLCEEWCLLLISLPIYLYIRNTKGNTGNSPLYTHIDSLIVGLCVGAIAMIRLNNTAPIIGFVLWHLIKCIQGKDFKRLWNDIAIICGGMAIVFFLCSLFYLTKADWTGVYEMIYGTFVFNILYINKAVTTQPLSLFLIYLLLPILFSIVTFISLFKIKSHLVISVPVFISYIITLLTTGRFGFVHYMINFIPLFIITNTLFFLNAKKWSYFVITLLTLPAFYIGYDAIDHLIFRLRRKTANTEVNDGFHRFVSSLPPDERKSIYNAGLNHMGAGLFADENIYQCNRIIYKGHTTISKRLQEYEATHGIKELQPTWILTQSPRPEEADEYMITHYTLADSIPGGEFDPIWCWKKNEHESL